ncbi:MAG TPA: toll/interleukin-1 receptor domain-containing protein, partial [Isosphaeraceae bacterium]|nr:toll/interleukin-1 receptor domain-containing protein [Isosphaeraceae bacterium]
MSSLGPKRYHAFLSYNSQDRTAVEDMERRLRAEGLTPYLELRELPPGREFQPALAEALRDSKTCVMFLGPSGLGPWQSEELQVAIDTRVRDRDFHVIPVLLPGAERPRRGDVAQLEFLINASWVEFLNTLDDQKEFRRLVWGITGKKPDEPAEHPYQAICPYRGLAAFQPEDAKFFFGRENLTGWLVSALRREVHAPQGVRFLAVLGPSGSGKSSVVLAGLVPRLLKGGIEGSERWPVSILRPGDDPLQALTEQVVPVLRRVRNDSTVSEFKEQQELLDSLRAEGDDAFNQLNRYAGLKFSDEPEGRRLLIVVDQFEEVFTYRPQDGLSRQRFERAREVFLASLLRAAAALNGRVAVVLTMRSDFLSACAPFPQLSAVLSAHQELVGPMTPAELRAAIEQPAFLVGCEVEQALTERLLADVKGQSGALPLLQFALTGVWRKRDVRRLTREAYIELGRDKNGQ